MASYYYLAASLPALKAEKEPPFTEEEFLALCRRHLTEKDAGLIDAVGRGDPAGNRTADAWAAFDSALDAELAYLRAERLQLHERDTYARVGYTPVSVRETVKKAVTADSPLDAEYMLQRVRFAFLEELAVNHFFDITYIIVYYLKLKMLIRASYFTYELGEHEFKRLLSNIKTSIKSV